MLQPRRTKFRKVHKMKMKGNAQRGNQLAYGTFGIKATEGARLRQLVSPLPVI